MTLLGSAGKACPGAATTATGDAAAATHRTVRASSGSPPKSSQALGAPMRELSPPQRTTPARLLGGALIRDEPR